MDYQESTGYQDRFEADVEGPVARTIEKQTARLPSDTFLWAAIGSMGVSAALQMMHKPHAANFVGHWAPTLLVLGVYNKMVKLLGSDRQERSMSSY
jgi:hypothetical protein